LPLWRSSLAVIAGSARTPVIKGADTVHYNQSLIFDHDGKQKLAHHKQYQYSITIGEQQRYGLLDAFGQLEPNGRYGGSNPSSLRFLILRLARIAVLICEDLSVEHVVEPLIVQVWSQWLFVPVLDGCQRLDRWTANFGRPVRQARSVCCGRNLSQSGPEAPTQYEGNTTQIPGVGTVAGTIQVPRSGNHSNIQ
jgi:predicted amidohydrolase